MRFITVKEVSQITGLSVATIYRRIKQGTFPLPRNTGGQAVRWFLKDIEEWMESCVPQG